jgi:hypothetical protein
LGGRGDAVFLASRKPVAESFVYGCHRLFFSFGVLSSSGKPADEMPPPGFHPGVSADKRKLVAEIAMIYFLAGFSESIGNFLNFFFVPIFLITLVVIAIPVGPDHVAHWNNVSLPAVLAGGTWCLCVFCRMVKMRIMVNETQARYRFRAF